MPAYADNYLNITSTDAIVTLSCPDVIPNPVQLQNFAQDQIIAIDDVVMAEVRTGVDGGLAAGYIPGEKTLNMSLEANSPSTQYLEAIVAAMDKNRTTYNCSITVTLPALGKRYIYSNGVITQATRMSSPKKLLEPTNWQFKYARMQVEQI